MTSHFEGGFILYLQIKSSPCDVSFGTDRWAGQGCFYLVLIVVVVVKATWKEESKTPWER
jgi:hypothetical protein